MTGVCHGIATSRLRRDSRWHWDSLLVTHHYLLFTIHHSPLAPHALLITQYSWPIDTLCEWYILVNGAGAGTERPETDPHRPVL